MGPRCLLLVVAALLLVPAPVRARDTEGPTGAAPTKNFSNIHASVDWVVKAFERAEADVRREDWPAAVRALQPIVDRLESREAPGDAAPYVRSVLGSSVYEGAWIVARHRVARGGDAALAAYEREYGGAAEALFEAAARRRDLTRLRTVATRFLPLAAGRRAALLLIDLALERGDADAALAWVETLEDLEAVSTESEARRAPWRAARVRRQALLLARDEASLPAVTKALARADPAEGFAIDAVPYDLRRRPPPPRTWPTTGGNAARSAVPAALGHAFRLAWFRPPSRDDDLADVVDPVHGEHDRPSPWLPPRAVSTEEHLFVSDGQYLHIYDLDDGSRVFERDATEFPAVRHGGIGEDNPRDDRRQRFGLLEGHALTLHPMARVRVPADDGSEAGGGVAGPGHLVLAAVPDGRDWGWNRARTEAQATRDDHLQAAFWDGERLRWLWRVGGATAFDDPADVAFRGGLPNDTRLYGAPVVYRGRVWIAGIRPAKATQDRWEVWMFSVDPATGRVATRTHLGTGTPMRTGRMDEVIPSSPAAARGRVVVSTSLGIVAAVDAMDGRIQWVHRYDRNVETERGRRRNRDSRDRGLRATSFCNEPPILALDRCYVTPTDSQLLLRLFDRPRTRARLLTAGFADDGGVDRDYVGWKFMPEHIAGVVPGTPTRPSSLVIVGKGEGGDLPGSIVVVHTALGGEGIRWPRTDRPDPRREAVWRGVSPTGFGAEPFGRALVTQAEVFVPQAHGIAMFELHDRNGDGSRFLGVLDRAAMSAEMAREAPPRPYGNLIPIPGRGIVSVSTTTIAFWARK